MKKQHCLVCNEWWEEDDERPAGHEQHVCDPKKISRRDKMHANKQPTMGIERTANYAERLSDGFGMLDDEDEVDDD